MVTKLGQAKKTEFKEYDSRNTTLVAINLTEGDELVTVRTTGGDNEMLLFTAKGQGIRFSEGDLRPMGRATRGVRGIKLREGDEVVARLGLGQAAFEPVDAAPHGANASSMISRRPVFRTDCRTASTSSRCSVMISDFG